MSVFLFALLVTIAPVSDYCPSFGDPVYVAVSDYEAIEVIESADVELLQEPLSWNAADTFWCGYDCAQAFDMPQDTARRYFMRFRLADDSERWMMVLDSRETPEVYYVFAFQNTTPYADRNGQHYGHHPCRAFKVDTGVIDAWVKRIAE